MILRRSLAMYIMGLLALVMGLSSLTYFIVDQQSQRTFLDAHEISRDRDIRFIIHSLVESEAERLDGLVRTLQGREDLIVDIAVTSAEGNYVGPLMDLMERLAGELSLDIFVVTNSEGRIIYSAGVPDARGMSPEYTRAYALSKKDVTIQVGRTVDGWAVRAMAPAWMGKVRAGSIVIGTRIDNEMAARFARATNTEITFASAAQIVASSRKGPDSAHMDIPKARSAIENNLVHRVRKEGSHVVSNYGPFRVHGALLSLIVEFDSSEYVALNQESRGRHLRVFAAFGLIALAMGGVLTLHMVAPLVRLRERAEATVREIGGEQKARDVKGDEIQSLVSSFDFMVESVTGHLKERRKMEAELTRQALYDALTGLPNRGLFTDRLKNLFAHIERNPQMLFAVLFLDLDHFKRINDTMGHLFGDRVLVAASERIGGCVRPGDTVSRFGGDEFVIILDDLGSQEDAIAAAHRIHDAMKKPMHVKGQEIYMTASIGIALSSSGYAQHEHMLRDADNAMYHAKLAGRARFAVFDEHMHSAAMHTMTLENELRKAVERGEFVLHYQPIIRLDTGGTMGLEALIRWEHPVKGLMLPETFIPVAEESGLIVPIGDWVLREACTNMNYWQRRFHMEPALSVSVNISPRQFDPSLPGRVGRALEESGLSPSSLKLEITENIIMESAALASTLIEQLLGMGVHVYLDDFGTGYSSLNYIHKFPVKALKVDRSFVGSIRDNREAQEIVRAIASLASNLGMTLIIEGVEDANQLEIFRLLACKYIQGNLFSPPMNAPDVERYLESTGKPPLLRRPLR